MINIISMSKEEKENLENTIKALLKVNNANLMMHYTSALLTHEQNISKKGENYEHFSVLIDSLRDEILRRMNT